MADVVQTMTESAYDFQYIVWPVIKDEIGGGELRMVETVTDVDFAKELDVIAGVDAWQILDNQSGMRGLASRVQWQFVDGKKQFDAPYNTFTVRIATRYGNDTEYQKRMYALEHRDLNVLYPAIAVQAYLIEKQGALLSVAAIPTHELMSILSENWEDLYTHQAPGGNSFKPVSWQLLNDNGTHIKIIDRSIKQMELEFKE